MAKMVRSYSRWVGTQDEIERAVERASETVHAWSRLRSVVSVDVDYVAGLSESYSRFSDVAYADLQRIKDLRIDVRPDADEYQAEHIRVRVEWREREAAALAAGREFVEPAPEVSIPSERVFAAFLPKL